MGYSKNNVSPAHIQTYKGARKNYASGYFVSRDGKTVWGKGGKDKYGLPTMKKVKIQTSQYGVHYIWSPKCGEMTVARMVADCYCPPIPQNGKQYALVHKDGNWGG